MPRSYNFWFFVHRTKDVPGEWTAHCLELDVVSQGTSVKHAVMMLFEACSMVLADDLGANRDPLERRAPDEFWADLYKAVREGKPADLSKIDESRVRNVAGQCLFLVARRASRKAGQPSAQTRAARKTAKAPLAWKPAKVPLAWMASRDRRSQVHASHAG
ncbi:MAG TPA: hypothetical protein VGQ83_22705 [Polyangia bacterium]|jgi:hypothetical protein